MDLLRFATIGSVDDGKSTLIGRLIVDTRQLLSDQIEAIEAASQRRGIGDLDLSFVTDGLRAEREQGITIDVAYRHAATPTRKFVIADCPGHVQYTANMATGASTATAALVVVDATAGLKEQSKRHLCIASLLGVRHFIVCANKMDLVDWNEASFRRIEQEMLSLPPLFVADSITVIPISALLGDNVVEHSSAAPYYGGPTVLEALETCPSSDHVDVYLAGGARMPVQWILREPGKGRRYAGMVDGSPLRVGDPIVVLPDGIESTVTEIATPSGIVDEAPPGISVSLILADDIDASRGDLIASLDDPATVTNELSAVVCWFSTTPLRSGNRFRIKHTTKTTPGIVTQVLDRFESTDFSLVAAESLDANDIGTVIIQTAVPLAVDDYEHNRTTGSFIVIDEATNIPVGAGMIRRRSTLN
jgi:bifunctional enzyme CysN/CysC